MSEEKDKCDTCEHRGDSSNEYCGSCGGGVESNWKEAGWSKDKTINELRTRVAELEAEAKMGNIPYKEAVKLRTHVAELESRLEAGCRDDEKQCVFLSEREELKKRVAELEQRMIDQANMICKKANEADMERRTAEMHCADAVKLSKRVEELEETLKYTDGIRSRDSEDIIKHNEELQNRLSTVEKENQKYKQFEERYAKVMERFDLIYAHELIDTLDCLEARADDLEAWRKKAIDLESKLSTLLKASEGMEKSLEKVIEDVVQHGNEYEESDWNPDCHLQYPITLTIGEFRKAKVALADFRAVKDEL